MDMELGGGGDSKQSPMTKEQIFDRLCRILRDNAMVPEDTEIRMASVLSGSLGLDSLDLIDFNREIEREFGVQLSDDEFYDMDTYTVGVLCDVIERKVKDKA